MVTKIQPLIITGLALGACLGCLKNSNTNRRQLNFVPAGQMASLGEQTFVQLKKDAPISKDNSLRERIFAIGERIAAASDADFKWEFELFDDKKTVNAFCLPGGKIGVYTGILPVATNDAGLAAVLGHEVAHAILEHGAERLSQSLLLQAGLSVAELTLSNEEHRKYIVGALGLGAQFGVLLPYSRLHESEADTVGLKYMAKAGYDPQEAVSLWKRMAKLGSGAPELLSTHPDPLRRAETLEKEQSKVKGIYESSEKQPTRALPSS